MSGWFDIGVNLTSPRLDAGATVEQAIAAGVPYMAVTGTSYQESVQAVELAASYPGHLISTAGIHPHYSQHATEDDYAGLRELVRRPEVVAIGECGLDFNRNFSSPEAQLSCFEAQLELAVETGLPVFLHERDAFDQQIKLLEKYRPSLAGGVAHCFTGDLRQMQGYLELDLFIGITGWLCDPKRGEALRSAVTQLPLKHVLLETDAPYLMPKTLKTKDKHNVPANLPHIAAAVAELMQVDVVELQQAALDNTCRLFACREEGQRLVV